MKDAELVAILEDVQKQLTHLAQTVDFMIEATRKNGKTVQTVADMNRLIIGRMGRIEAAIEYMQGPTEEELDKHFKRSEERSN